MAPTPDTPPQRNWSSFRPGAGWVVVFVLLLAINVFFSNRATEPASRVRVPYSPFFVDQVTSNHVSSITSKGTAIQGTFTEKLSYDGSKPTKEFKTEIPAFANTDRLSNL